MLLAMFIFVFLNPLKSAMKVRWHEVYLAKVWKRFVFHAWWSLVNVPTVKSAITVPKIIQSASVSYNDLAVIVSYD